LGLNAGVFASQERLY